MDVRVGPYRGWVAKNCFQTVVLEKTLESSLDCKEIKPVNPKGNQSWIFIERTDTEAPILWPPDGKSWLIGKNPDAGKDWRREEKGTTEDEMVGWHHRVNNKQKFSNIVHYTFFSIMKQTEHANVTLWRLVVCWMVHKCGEHGMN